MKMDNTLNLIAKIHFLMNEMIVRELEMAGIVGLAPSHGAILATLFDKQEVSMCELAKSISKTPQTVTTLVGKLVKLGYVKTYKLKEDKRSTIVTITEEGLGLSAKFREISEQLYEKQYQGMSKDEIQDLRQSLEKIIGNMQI